MYECTHTHTHFPEHWEWFPGSTCGCFVTCPTQICPVVCSLPCPLTQRELQKQLLEAGERPRPGWTALHVKCCECSELRILQKALRSFQHPGQSFQDTQSEGTGFWCFKALISCLMQRTLAWEVRLSYSQFTRLPFLLVTFSPRNVGQQPQASLFFN